MAPTAKRIVATLTMFLLVAGGVAHAQDAIIQVDEEWELTIGTPSPDRGSPQLTFLMSPQATVGGLYSVFVVNQRTLPASQEGGMQLQLWHGNTPLSVNTYSDTNCLENTGERITWTQRMSLKNGVLTFEILNGKSSTWGNFGKNGELAVSVSTSLENLNGYNPDVTVANTGIDFGNARVSKLMLKKVRSYTSTTKSVERVSDRIVYQHQ